MGKAACWNKAEGTTYSQSRCVGCQHTTEKWAESVFFMCDKRKWHHGQTVEKSFLISCFSFFQLSSEKPWIWFEGSKKKWISLTKVEDQAEIKVLGTWMNTDEQQWLTAETSLSAISYNLHMTHIWRQAFKTQRDLRSCSPTDKTDVKLLEPSVS